MPPPPFAAHLDVNKTRVRAGFSALAAIAALTLVWNARTAALHSGLSFEALVPVGFGLAVFFLFAATGFRAWQTLRQTRKTPILVIDTNGVTDTRVGPQPIPWSAIVNAELIDLTRDHFNRLGDEDTNQHPKLWGVRLIVTGAASYMSGNGVLGATSKMLIDATNYRHIDINPSDLDTSPEAILSAVQAHLDAYVR